jgi:hypothetical protein
MLLQRFSDIGKAQVKGYKSFAYIRETDNMVIIQRENGNEARVPIKTINKAIEAVRNDQDVYNHGPSALRAYGITHVTSPVWAILHLATLRELCE